ncbi:dihydrolipoamide acetyltransferase family protein [Actinoplanes sp. NPDC049599]|uniref:dihydrolipoamide acetyltransferase family protein n=1 Tax=Actinoplanes sp. NPDC049599 TaxID=3363903 RepID=UPI00378E8031
MAEFRMPSLGADMTDGVLLEWLVRPGAEVGKGDIVAVVDTDKAAIEVECFDSGTVQQLLVEPGTRVPVGTPLAIIATGPPAESAPSPVLSPLVRREAHERHVDLQHVHGSGPGGRITRRDVERAAEVTPASPAPAPAPAPAVRLRVSPRAQRLARDTDVDLSAVTGTGPGGAIRAADVRLAADRHRTEPASPAARAAEPGSTAQSATTGAEPASPAARAAEPGSTAQSATTRAEPAAPPVTEPGAAASAGEQAARRAAAMRATIAALMARSKREIPHYYLTETIDLSAALAWLRDRNQALPVPQRIVPAALLLKAAARAAREVPELNGFWLDDRFLPAPAVHLGVAVSLRGGGLVAPAIMDADTLPVEELMSRLKDLVARTRSGRLRGAELSSPTLTVSNLGEQGVESIIGVIYPPQVALVGFGTVVERPWAVDGLLGIRRLVTASLAADHRATDGATGARYLRTLSRLLHRPEEL